MLQKEIQVSQMLGSRFKSCIPYLFECFKVNYPLLNGARICVLIANEDEEKPTPIEFHYSMLDRLNDKNLVLFQVFDEKQSDSLWQIANLPIAYFRTLSLVEHLYIHLSQSSRLEIDTLTDDEADVIQDIIDENDYIDHIRPDMLQLYNFINDWKKIPQEQAVTLICGSKKLQLNNKRNWIFKAINDHLEEHLGVASVEEAEDELIARYSKKTGRKANKYQTLILYGIDKLYQKATNSEEITNQQCQFIREYLKYLGIPISQDDFDHEDDIKNIRSRIRYLRKNGCSARWSND